MQNPLLFARLDVCRQNALDNAYFFFRCLREKSFNVILHCHLSFAKLDQYAKLLCCKIELSDYQRLLDYILFKMNPNSDATWMS